MLIQNGPAPDAEPLPLPVPVPLVARVAVLDHDGVYWPPLEERRPEAVKPGELVFGDPLLKDVLPEGAVYVDAGCDLPGGKYTWGGACFVPLAREKRKETPGVPTLEQALYDYLAGLGASLPPRTAAWVEWFRKTMDERGKGGV